jgi:UDP-glucuronate 4-epimerase
VSKKILVTGAAGFIGYHLCERLVSRGDQVVGLDYINDYYDVNLKFSRLANLGIDKANISENNLIKSSTKSNFSFVKMALEDREEVLQLFSTQKFDAVCNLAAQAGVRYSLTNPYTYIDSNIVGFINILEGCRQNQVGHFAYASSSSVYGMNKQLPFSTSDNVDHPVSLYAATKKANELMAHTYSHLYKIPSTGLRFFTVYGPWGRPDMALFLFTDAILKGEPINVFNHGKMIRDFTYVDDIVEGVIRVIDHPPKPDPEWIDGDTSTSSAPYKVYNIGNNNPIQLMDFIKEIEKALGQKAIINMMDIQPGDVAATYADVSDLVRDLDYKPDTSIVDGIGAFIKWYRNYYNK